MARHRRRLSGPLLDRIDLLVNLQRAPACESVAAPLTSSAEARQQVALARERQAARLATAGLALNAHMDVRVLQRHARLDQKGGEMLSAARQSGLVNARGEHRVLRVARTIADLDGSGRVRGRDIGAALALRADVSLTATRAA
jgi:magnesium chelatase family protein